METEIDTKEFIVIDNGSGYIKAGFSGEDSPRIVIPTAVGSQQPSEPGKPLIKKIGNDLDLRMPTYPVSFPIDRGVIKDSEQDWEHVVKLWEYVFRELEQEPSTCNVLLTDAPRNTRENRMRMTEIMFTRFRVQSLGICSTSVLALFSTGRTRGVVVDVGDGLTSAVPVFEGYALPHAIRIGHIAGKDVTDIILNSLLPDIQPTQLDLARKIKEQMVVVPANYEEALTGPSLLSEEMRSFELPGERIIQINKKAQLDAAEVLFNPAVVGLAEKSVPQLALESILKCDNDLRNNLFANIVLAGGTTMMAGFVERFEQEILSDLPPEILRSDVHIAADSFREHAAWIGGSMLASLETWSKYMTITKDSWDNTEPDKRPSLVQKISF